jgi:hypothetical protein
MTRLNMKDQGRFMPIEENKVIVGRWFTEFWGADFNPAVIDELAAPGIRVVRAAHQVVAIPETRIGHTGAARTRTTKTTVTSPGPGPAWSVRQCCGGCL